MPLWGGFSNYDLTNYGADGTFINLDPYITPEIMPNLSAILEENPNIRSAITMSDGCIYGLPAAEQMGTAGIGKEEDYSIYTIPQFSMINKAWLDDLGLAVPTTLEELHTALKAFKDNDMSHKFYGNDAGITIPMSTGFDQWCWARTSSTRASASPTGPTTSAMTWSSRKTVPSNLCAWTTSTARQ